MTIDIQEYLNSESTSAQVSTFLSAERYSLKVVRNTSLRSQSLSSSELGYGFGDFNEHASDYGHHKQEKPGIAMSICKIFPCCNSMADKEDGKHHSSKEPHPILPVRPRFKDQEIKPSGSNLLMHHVVAPEISNDQNISPPIDKQEPQGDQICEPINSERITSSIDRPKPQDDANVESIKSPPYNANASSDEFYMSEKVIESRSPTVRTNVYIVSGAEENVPSFRTGKRQIPHSGGTLKSNPSYDNTSVEEMYVSDTIFESHTPTNPTEDHLPSGHDMTKGQLGNCGNEAIRRIYPPFCKDVELYRKKSPQKSVSILKDSNAGSDPFVRVDAMSAMFEDYSKTILRQKNHCRKCRKKKPNCCENKSSHHDAYEKVEELFQTLSSFVKDNKSGHMKMNNFKGMRKNKCHQGTDDSHGYFNIEVQQLCCGRERVIINKN